MTTLDRQVGLRALHETFLARLTKVVNVAGQYPRVVLSSGTLEDSDPTLEVEVYRIEPCRGHSLLQDQNCGPDYRWQQLLLLQMQLR